ncbi:MAG: SPOR domain-containing protein, partial [Candidatus Methylomirabilales bacterium]
AFPYWVWALTSQEGEPFRKMVQDLEGEGLRVFVGEGSQEKGIEPSLLVGRFETREEADAVLKKMQRLEGLKRVEVIQTGYSRARREQ